MQHKFKFFSLPIVILLLVSSVVAEVTLPSIINHQVVLPHGVKAPIWGWAAAREKVSVSFAGQTKDAAAASDGKWMVQLDPLAVSAKSQGMIIKGKNTITRDDVLVGEVWIASGQSDMEFSIGAIAKEKQQVVSAEIKNKLLRMFCVAPKIQSSLPLQDTAGYWSDPSYFVPLMEKGEIRSYDSHSAVGFFLGLKLQQALQVPVGIIDTSWGGTKIEPWIADAGYELEGITYRKAVYIESLSIGSLHSKKVPENIAEINASVIAQNKSYRSRGMRTERYKYFSYYEHSPVVEELYDMLKDSQKENNLILNPEYTSVLNNSEKKPKNVLL